MKWVENKMSRNELEVKEGHRARTINFIDNRRSLLITVVLSPIFIPFLRRLKFGQSIRDEGPKFTKKSGTPTMGGIMILLSIIVATLIMVNQYAELTYKTFLLLFVTIGFGLLGFLDDFIKVVLKRNLGLTSKQKF